MHWPVCAQLGIASIANDFHQPWTRIASPKAWKETERAQARLLDCILGVALITHQPASEVVGGVHVRQDHLVKTRKIITHYHRSLHGCAVGLTMRFRASLSFTGKFATMDGEFLHSGMNLPC